MDTAVRIIGYVFCGFGLIQNIAIMVLFCVKSDMIIRIRPQFSRSLVLADTFIAFCGLLRQLLTTLYPDVRNQPVGVGATVKTVSMISAVSLMLAQWSQLCFVLDRFISVRFPFKHRNWLSSKKGNIMNSVMWGLWVILIALLLVVSFIRTPPARESLRILLLTLVSLMLMPALPSLVLFIWTQFLVFRTKSEEVPLRKQEENNKGSLKTRIAESKRILTLSAMMSFATTFGWPTYTLLHYFCRVQRSPALCPAGADVFRRCCLLFGYVTLVTDPWVFALVPKACYRKLRRLFREAEEPDQSILGTVEANFSTTV